MVTVQRRPFKFFDRSRNKVVYKGRPSSDLDHRGAARRHSCDLISMVEEIARVKGQKVTRFDSERSVFCACIRTHACIPIRIKQCMPAGVIDISKYAMADRSQRAGTNNCSTAHTATYEYIDRGQ